MHPEYFGVYISWRNHLVRFKMVHSNTKNAKFRVCQSQVCYLWTTHSSALKQVTFERERLTLYTNNTNSGAVPGMDRYTPFWQLNHANSTYILGLYQPISPSSNFDTRPPLFANPGSGTANFLPLISMQLLQHIYFHYMLNVPGISKNGGAFVFHFFRTS